ncbi:MAG: CpsB/CapC family capsule biosynthesis tyrosine phosphatase [Thermoguttaceae bacterium]
MNVSEPFVDIHCHLLPGLDDGAATLDDSLAMAELAVADGFRTIVATPHQLGNHAGNGAAAIRMARDRVEQVLDRRGLPLRVLPGADVRIEPDLIAKIHRDEVMTLADRRRHVLLELPHEVYVPLDRLLSELAAARLVGILSHPERNTGILGQPGVLRPLVQRGCLLQITAGSLIGTFGARIQQFAESLVEQGLVHFVATDAHGTRSRPPLMSAAFERLVKIGGRETALELCCRNPARVASGGDVRPERAANRARRWLERVCCRSAHV